MIRTLLLFFAICWMNILSAQIQYDQYSYSFKGYTDFENFEREVALVEGIHRFKIQMKEKNTDDFGGEILFEIAWDERLSEHTPSLDILYELKKIVLQAGLEPMDLVKLTRK